MYYDEPIKFRSVTIFDIYQFLMRYSSDTHPVSCNEIALGIIRMLEFTENAESFFEEEYDEVDIEYAPKLKYEWNEEYDSVRRQVTRLLDKYVDFEMPLGRIVCIAAEDEKSRKDHFLRSYYIEHAFDEYQINMLRDAISVYPYAEQGITKSIIDNINKLTPIYNREEYNPEKYSARKYSGSYFENLDCITRALSRTKTDYVAAPLTSAERKMTNREYKKSIEKPINKIAFKYCSYNENKELLVHPAKDGCEIRSVNPVRLMWANGYYYLVTFTRDEKTQKINFVNYRVDRMTDVVCLDEKSETLTGFSNEKYRYENPVMYSDNKTPDERERIIIKCKRFLINNALDTFGFGIHISTENMDDGYVLLDLGKISPEGVKMWALEYGDSCEVLEPADLRKSIFKTAQNMFLKYSD